MLHHRRRRRPAAARRRRRGGAARVYYCTVLYCVTPVCVLRENHRVCVAGRVQLGRCRTLACRHQWGRASAAQGLAQPRLACCTTGTGGGDDPRRARRRWRGGAARVCGWQGAAWQVSHTCLLLRVRLLEGSRRGGRRLVVGYMVGRPGARGQKGRKDGGNACDVWRSTGTVLHLFVFCGENHRARRS